MLNLFFLVAWRNIFKNKVFSIINISGLAIGMAVAMLMVIWLQDEVTHDQFHTKKDRIYEVWNRASFSGELHCWNTTPKVLGPTMEKDFPEVERAVRVNWPSTYLFSVGDKRLKIRGNVVENGFLDVFTFPLEKGHTKSALDGIYSIVITEDLGRKLFGTEDPMGKEIKVDNKDVFTVKGVLKKLPGNSRFNFEFLIPWKYLEKNEGGPENNWGNNSTRTYVLLKPGVNVAGMQAKMKVLKPRYDQNEPKWEMFIYPLERWRLYSNFENGVEVGGRITMIWLFGIIAGFVLLIACINFMNLSTARSEKRAKEVGIRKVVGATRPLLMGQFIAESIFISFLASILAVGLVYLGLPTFNQMAEKKLAIDWADQNYWLGTLAFILLTGILAGSYPAFFLSAFRPVQVLKGTFRPVKAAFTPRKVLVVTQFVFAICLIISTIIVRMQISHAQERESGYNKNNLIYVFLEGETDRNFELIRNEILASGAATSISRTSSPLTEGWSDGWGFEWEGKGPNDKTDFDRLCADDQIGKTAGFRFVHGRDFDLHTYPSDSTGMIINEAALKVMKFKNPIGQLVKDNGIEWHIVGVIKDFILRSPYHPTTPMAIEGAIGWFNVAHIKVNDSRPMKENLSKIESVIKKYNPEYPVGLQFIDQEYAAKFEDESRMSTLAGFFAGLTIFISCLGLFGLAAYMAENRIKEIGIRKVLGASVLGIVQLLSIDFLLLVCIALGIACPLAWWAMHEWLESYTYRVAIEWYVFLIAGVLALLIALLTVSFQAIKAAIANPVKSLRNE